MMKKTIAITGGIIIAVSAILLIIIQIDGRVWVNRLNMNRAYAREIREYLEEKYEEEFYVQPRWVAGGHMWRPQTPPRTVFFYAYPLSDPTYVFRVHVTRQMPSYQIEEIRDHYYWRFLREQLQEHVKDHFLDMFGEEIKVDIEPPSASDGFPRELDHTSTLEDFWASEERVSVGIRVFIPNHDVTLENNIIEQTRALALQLGESNSFLGSITIFYVDDISVFNSIDTSVDEGIRLNYHEMHGTVRLYSPAFWSRSAGFLSSRDRSPYLDHFIILTSERIGGGSYEQ